jgi:hypothetical protein
MTSAPRILAQHLVQTTFGAPHQFKSTTQFFSYQLDKPIANLSWLLVSIKLIFWQPTHHPHTIDTWTTSCANHLWSSTQIQAHHPN